MPALSRTNTLLLAICAAAAIPILYLGSFQFMEYDGFWHVFIAQENSWQAFWWDYMTNDHPLLFYLLLKLVMRLGHTVLIYRSISMASGIASVFVAGKIAEKLSTSKFTPYLTALAFGLSIPLLEIALSVRSYMLSVFFVLVSFYFLLDLLPVSGEAPRWKTRACFTLSTALAVSSHYFTFFYVGACGILLFGFTLVRAPRLWKIWLGHVAMLLPVGGLMAYFYFSHLSTNLTNLNHVTEFLYQGHEPKVKYILRGLHSLFNFFSPWHIADRRPFEKVAALLAASAIGVTAFARARAAAPLLMLLLLIVETAVAGILALYPFGGFLRQQFLMFPFLVLSAGICFDRLLTGAGKGRTAVVVAALTAVAIVAVFGRSYSRFPKIHGELYAHQMGGFNKTLPAARAIYVDQFNLIVFYTFHHQWDWRFTGIVPMEAPVTIDRYAIDRGNEHLRLFRDKFRWIFDFTEVRLFEDIGRIMRRNNLDELDVFSITPDETNRSAQEQDAYQRQALALAAAHHLIVRKFVPEGRGVYAEFALDHTAPAAGQ